MPRGRYTRGIYSPALNLADKPSGRNPPAEDPRGAKARDGTTTTKVDARRWQICEINLSTLLNAWLYAARQLGKCSPPQGTAFLRTRLLDFWARPKLQPSPRAAGEPGVRIDTCAQKLVHAVSASSGRRRRKGCRDGPARSEKKSRKARGFCADSSYCNCSDIVAPESSVIERDIDSSMERPGAAAVTYDGTISLRAYV